MLRKLKAFRVRFWWRRFPRPCPSSRARPAAGPSPACLRAPTLALAELYTGGQDILHVARDGQRLERLQDDLRFFAPEREVLVFPAWDCLPYDRLSPHPDIVAERLETLVRLAQPEPGAPGASFSPRWARPCRRCAARPLCRAAVVLKRARQSTPTG